MKTNPADESTGAAIHAAGLSFRFGSREVVNIPEFRLASSSSMAVIGPSGCGKTTFLHLLAGLLRPQSGTLHILGEDISRMSGTRLDRFRGQHMGMVFQRLYLLPALTVQQNVELAQRLARTPRDSSHVQHLLEQLNVAEFAEQKPRRLSQGQAQRVAIARALVHRPALVLADEPTSALDDNNAQLALALLQETARQAGAALLVVTHDQRVRGQLDSEFEMEPLA